MRRRTLRLDLVELEAVDGYADQLEYRLIAERTTKGGKAERYTLVLKSCRYGVTELLTKLRDMHARDRLRLERETQRIAGEVSILGKTP